MIVRAVGHCNAGSTGALPVGDTPLRGGLGLTRSYHRCIRGFRARTRGEIRRMNLFKRSNGETGWYGQNWPTSWGVVLCVVFWVLLFWK